MNKLNQWTLSKMLLENEIILSNKNGAVKNPKIISGSRRKRISNSWL